MRAVVIGVGIAGRARVRAVQAIDGLELLGGYRGRFLPDLDIPVLHDLPAALQAADLAIISTPTDTHAHLVRKALQAGCHVVVEFPLASSEAEARGLFDLADERGRMLHVEHIELLSRTTTWMAEQVRGQRILEGGMVMDQPSMAGASREAFALSQVPRLHRWRCVGGGIDRVDLQRWIDGELHAEVTLAGAVPVSLVARRDPARRRGLDWWVRTDNHRYRVQGSTLYIDGEEVGRVGFSGLFEDDLRRALDALKGGGESYVSRDDILSVLGHCAALLR